MSNQREPLKIFVFSASMRAESLNSRLARLAAGVLEGHGAAVDLGSMREFDVGLTNPAAAVQREPPDPVLDRVDR